MTDGAGNRVTGWEAHQYPARSEISVGGDGVISLRPIGAEANGLAGGQAAIGERTGPTPKTPDGLLRSRCVVWLMKVVSSALEGNNVNVIDALSP